MSLPWAAMAGGGLIGASAVMLLATLGQVAGISGIGAGAVAASRGDRGWRWAFLFGLMLAAAAVLSWQGGADQAPRASLRDALPVDAALLRQLSAGDWSGFARSVNGDSVMLTAVDLLAQVVRPVLSAG